MNILIVDDEKGIRIGLSKLFEREGHKSFTADDRKTALSIVNGENINLALIDIRMGEEDGVELLKEIRKSSEETICLMITGYGSISNAVEAMRAGASDYLLKPLDNESLLKSIGTQLELIKLKNQNSLLKENQKGKTLDYALESNHPEMKRIYKIADKVKDTETTILITGESGTGKEVLSRYIHFSSNRRDAPFVGVNCAALSETLLLSELFGHERGSFTGAHEQKIGKFELADGGTLFLDEIGDMSLDAQAKLLRVLEEGSLERLGGNKTIEVNIRVIAATNQDMTALMETKRFREDLYYRLNVINLKIPALRERPEDIILLAEYFRNQYCRKYKKGECRFSEESLRQMENCHWQGNVRELRNLINQTVLLSDGPILEPGIIPSPVNQSTSLKEIDEEMQLQEKVEKVIEHYEKHFIREALEMTKYSKSVAAEKLGISRKTLFNKMQKYKL